MAKHRIVDIDELVCDPENARIHDDRNMDAIAKSLKRFGPGRSIVVDRDNIVRAGSGTMLIVADQSGRRCVGSEIAPVYCDVIVERWEKLTGKTAQRVPA